MDSLNQPRLLRLLPVYHRKFSFQLKPPQVRSEADTYSNVSSEMTSMMGQTTVLRSLATSASSGSSHPRVTWAEEKYLCDQQKIFHLHVRVEEGEDGARGLGGAEQPGPDEADPGGGAEDGDGDGQLRGHVLLEPGAEVAVLGPRAGVIHQDDLMQELRRGPELSTFTFSLLKAY